MYLTNYQIRRLYMVRASKTVDAALKKVQRAYIDRKKGKWHLSWVINAPARLIFGKVSPDSLELKRYSSYLLATYKSLFNRLSVCLGSLGFQLSHLSTGEENLHFSASRLQFQVYNGANCLKFYLMCPTLSSSKRIVILHCERDDFNLIILF